MTRVAIVGLALLGLTRAVAIESPQQLQTTGFRDAPASSALSLSASGRILAFQSAVALVHSDTNHTDDVYLLDIKTEQVTLVSRTPRGTAPNGTSGTPVVNGDGRFVAFESSAADLLPHGPAPPCSTIFLVDRVTNTTRAIARDLATDTLLCARRPSLDIAGTSVAFESRGRILLATMRAAPEQVVRLERLTLPAGGWGQAFGPSLSGDGQRIAYTASSCPIAASRARTCRTQVFLYDVRTATSKPVMHGRLYLGNSHSPAISHDGRWVAAAWTPLARPGAKPLLPAQVYVVEVETGMATHVSHTVRFDSGDDHSGSPSISGDGRFVAFESLATNLLCSRRCRARERDTNLVADVFVWNRDTRAITRVSRHPDGTAWWAPSVRPAIAADVRVAVFLSRQPTNSTVDARFDVFLATF